MPTHSGFWCFDCVFCHPGNFEHFRTEKISTLNILLVSNICVRLILLCSVLLVWSIVTKFPDRPVDERNQRTCFTRGFYMIESKMIPRTQNKDDVSWSTVDALDLILSDYSLKKIWLWFDRSRIYNWNLKNFRLSSTFCATVVFEFDSMPSDSFVLLFRWWTLTWNWKHLIQRTSRFWCRRPQQDTVHLSSYYDSKGTSFSLRYLQTLLNELHFILCCWKRELSKITTEAFVKLKQL